MPNNIYFKYLFKYLGDKCLIFVVSNIGKCLILADDGLSSKKERLQYDYSRES
jgi:hypothetical protein